MVCFVWNTFRDMDLPFLQFWEKNPPCTALFWSARLLILNKILPARLFHPMWTVLFWSARLLILRKKFPLYGLILVCTFIDFEEKFPPARLFHPARLLILVCSKFHGCQTFLLAEIHCYLRAPKSWHNNLFLSGM